MPVTEAQRNTLFNTLREKLGEPEAETMMELLPPVGWGEVATHRGLVALGGELRGETAQLGDRLRAEMAELRTELKTEMVDLRSELKSEMAELRSELKSEMAELRTEMAELRTEINTEIGDSRRKLESQIADVRLATVRESAALDQKIEMKFGEIQREMRGQTKTFVGWMLASQATFFSIVAVLLR